MGRRWVCELSPYCGDDAVDKIVDKWGVALQIGWVGELLNCEALWSDICLGHRAGSASGGFGADKKPDYQADNRKQYH